jgi:membrane protease YdiL (CAAX protease family)
VATDLEGSLAEVDTRRVGEVGPVVAVIAVANVLNNRWLTKTYAANSVAATVVLLTLARRRGLAWNELGLSRRTLRPGVTYAATSAAAVGGVYTLAFVVPATRTAFVDQRVQKRTRGVAVQALIDVPFGTVLLEEVAFRGVLWGLLNRRFGAAPATTVSSVLFGLWHALPSRVIARHNRAVGRVIAERSLSGVAVTALAIATTTAAGVLLCELRRRGGSLMAPAGLHWATNGLGYVFAAVANRCTR